MRSAILLTLTILVLLGGFWLYLSMQPNFTSRLPAEARATADAPFVPSTRPADDGSITGPGEDVWVKTYDEKTGRLAFQLRAARYDPQPGGESVAVQQPQAEIFLGDDTMPRVLRIEGTDGEVVMSSDAARRGEVRGQEGAPRRGKLHNVVISLFESLDMSHPTLVCHVNNLAFDNDTYRMSTEMFTDVRGVAVPADEVPVEVRGDDYDFDGRGLTIKWDGIDRRLSLLEVAHGERLVIKSVGAVESLARPPEARAASDAPHLEPEAQLASFAPEPRGAARRIGASTRSASTNFSLRDVYRASFFEAVRVTQDDQPLALADEMLVDFIASRGIPTADPTTPKPGPASPSTPHEKSAPSPATTATTREPIVVRWIGKLRVTPRRGETPPPLSGKFDVTLRARLNRSPSTFGAAMSPALRLNTTAPGSVPSSAAPSSFPPS